MRAEPANRGDRLQAIRLVHSATNQCAMWMAREQCTQWTGQGDAGLMLGNIALTLGGLGVAPALSRWRSIEMPRGAVLISERHRQHPIGSLDGQ